MIRSALKTDSSSLARLHIATLSSSFIASLGFNFLNKLYAFLIDKEKVWVYEEDNEVMGFVSFSENSVGMMKRFLINCPWCILLLVFKTLIHPTNLKRFLETFLAPYKSKKSYNVSICVNLPSSELLSISVNPNCQASGIGSQLLNALENYLLLNNITKYKVVAGENLVSANKFYLKNGFTQVMQIKIHGNKLSNVYIKKL